MKIDNKQLTKLLILVIILRENLYSNFFKILNSNLHNNIKICLCTLGKNENKYINEFVQHYKKYGVDKIYLYDNNDVKGEYFEDKIKKYIDSGFVEIINWRGITGGMTYYKIMDHCYQMHYKDFDWLIFYELDEFIYLKNYTRIKQYLNKKQFKKCDSIRLNWVHRSDNNLIFYEDKPLAKRFTKVGNNVKNSSNIICNIKTIIRGHLKNITIEHNHLLSRKLIGCNGFGKHSNLSNFLNLEPDYEYYYINHYYGKTVEEFIEKIDRGDLLRGNKLKVIKYAIEKFFYINDITIEKVSYIQKHLGSKYNISEFMKRYQTKKKKQ